MKLSPLFIYWILAGLASQALYILSQFIYYLRIRLLGFKYPFDRAVFSENFTRRVLLGFLALISSCFILGMIMVISNRMLRNRETIIEARKRHKLRPECSVPRIEVSAALDALVNGDCNSEEHMRKVILFAQTLPDASIAQFELNQQQHSRDSNIVTGHTSEHGNISTEFKDTDDELYEPIGKHKTRVGMFRIWMVYDDLIAFHHFWSSDVATAVPESCGGKRPDTYYIEFDQITLKPRCLAIAAPRIIFNVFGASVCRIELEPLWGSLKDPKMNAGYDFYN